MSIGTIALFVPLLHQAKIRGPMQFRSCWRSNISTKKRNAPPVYTTGEGVFLYGWSTKDAAHGTLEAGIILPVGGIAVFALNQSGVHFFE